MKKGFTLVELLAVIIILSALILVISIFVNPVIDTAKEGLSEVQIKNIEESAKAYYLKEGMNSDTFDLEEIRSCVNVEDLIELGYIDKDEIIDPEKEEKITGSVKITYRANNYTYKYQDKACTNYDMGIICERVKGTNVGNVPTGLFEPGDAYSCKVDPNMDPYKFYVLSKNDNGTINLIMERNICSDGTVATAENKCTVAWVSNLDYGCEGSYCVNKDKGPITAANYLNQSTSSWTNIPNLNLTYDDENKNFTNFKIEGKVRLPRYDEVYGTGKCLIYPDYGSCPLWLANYLNSSSYVTGEGVQNISGISGYWMLSSAYDDNSKLAWYVDSNAYIASGVIEFYDIIGIRPVITVYKSQIE